MQLCDFCKHQHDPRFTNNSKGEVVLRQRKRRTNARRCSAGVCRDCRQEREREWNKNNPGRHAAFSRKQRRKLWQEAFLVYGSSCSCCGETEPIFLTLDHVANDGAAVRKRIGPQVNQILTDLKQRGWPPEVRIMCFNCNSGRHRNGGECPHVEKIRMGRANSYNKMVLGTDSTNSL